MGNVNFSDRKEFNSVTCTPMTIILKDSGTIIHGNFTKDRVKNITLPNDMHMYCIRHSGNEDTIEPHVYLDFYGTFITETKIEFHDLDDKYERISIRKKRANVGVHNETNNS